MSQISSTPPSGPSEPVVSDLADFALRVHGIVPSGGRFAVGGESTDLLLRLSMLAEHVRYLADEVVLAVAEELQRRHP